MSTLIKQGSLLAVSALIGLTLVACSSANEQPETSPMPNPGETINNSESLDFFATETTEDLGLDLMAVTTPSIYNITDNSFTIIDGGSSSCRNVVESVTLSKAENLLTIAYETLPADTACTMDFVIYPQTITLEDTNVLSSQDELTFEVQTITGQTVVAEKISSEN